jgi:diguanylate cyclase (GGDEF)-like protein
LKLCNDDAVPQCGRFNMDLRETRASGSVDGAMLKRFGILMLPVLLLAIASLTVSRLGGLPPAWQEILPWLPYAVIAAGMLLSLNFHRGRAFYVLLMLALFNWSCATFLHDGLTSFRARMVYQALSLLLPLNILLFSFMRERGVLSLGGRLRIVFLAAQTGLVAWLVRYNYVGIEQFLAKKFVVSPLLNRFVIPQAALVVMSVAVLLIVLRTLLRQSPVDGGFLGTLAAIAVICGRQGAPDVTLVFVTAAALILTLTVLQDTYNMAFRDDLTGLPSRRALNEQLAGMGRRYVVAMVDVDHFKRFNDTYGHDVGDQVLKMVATRLQGVKGGGKPYRYGGEEFTIIFPRRRMADTLHHLEELRTAIAGYKLWLRSPDRPRKSREGEKNRTGGGGETAVSVTVSIGVAESAEGHTPAEIVRDADEALYRAKRKGRNRVCS